MKPKIHRCAVIRSSFFVTLLCSLPISSASAAEIAKLPDSTISIPFSDPAAWAGGVVPGSSDIALFDSTLGTSILGSMNTSQLWYGLKITNPQGVNVSNGYGFSSATAGGTFLGNLSIGAGGIDMSGLNLPTPPPSSIGFGISVPITLTADQTWPIADNASVPFELGLSGPTTGATIRPINLGGHTLTKSGAGSIGVFFNNVVSNGVINLNSGSIAFVNGLTSGTSSTYLNATRSDVTFNAAAGTTVSLSQVIGLGKVDWQAHLNLASATLAVNPYSTSISNIDVGGTIATTGTSTISYSSTGSSTSIANPTISAPITGSGTLNFAISTATANRQNDRFTLSGSTSGFTGTFALTGTTGLRTLRLAGAAANSPSASWQVVDGGTLEAAATTGAFSSLQTGGTVRVGTNGGTGGTLTVGSLTQTGGNLEADIGSLHADQFAVTGAYTTTGGGLQVNLQSAPNAGTYTPMTYASISGAPSVTFSPALSDTRFSASPVVGASAISFAFTGASETRTWVGTNGTDAWDLNTTATWSGGDLLFKHLDTVVFDDSATTTTPVIGVNVVPNSILINNPTKAYTFTATGTCRDWWSGGWYHEIGSGTGDLGWHQHLRGPGGG
ncbi:MAG: hypothetical protein QM755_00795 [Luteolibacter sp.]